MRLAVEIIVAVLLVYTAASLVASYRLLRWPETIRLRRRYLVCQAMLFGAGYMLFGVLIVEVRLDRSHDVVALAVLAFGAAAFMIAVGLWGLRVFLPLQRQAGSLARARRRSTRPGRGPRPDLHG